jgi:trehalose 6-phosphate synthase
VLILSQFAGAAQQLRAALLVNPLRAKQCADAIARALRMPAVEQSTRMRVLRSSVTSFDASWWASQLLRATSMAEPAIAHAEQERWSEAVA